jgi:hypothetical protein
MNENPAEIDPRIEALERLCDQLRHQLAKREAESRSARRPLELQKIMLAQERDDLFRQRQALLRECSALKARVQQLESGRPAAASARRVHLPRFQALFHAAWSCFLRPSKGFEQHEIDLGNSQ